MTMVCNGGQIEGLLVTISFPGVCRAKKSVERNPAMDSTDIRQPALPATGVAASSVRRPKGGNSNVQFNPGLYTSRLV
ncbi:MAG: hypothetical protein U0T81_14790 [Saprospiraceae bacterium]